MSQLSILKDETQAGPSAAASRTGFAGERGELLIALLVFAAAILYLWPMRDFLSFNADEGVTLAMAERILRGQVPYRDFFSLVTPGSPFLMALWFKIFDTSFLVARSVLLVYA